MVGGGVDMTRWIIRKLADGVGLSEFNAVLSEVREERCVIGSEVVVR